MKVVAVIPAYNESGTISKVVRSTAALAQEVIVVDDASTDATAARATEAGATVIVRHENGGVGAALQTGYGAALEQHPDIVLQLDADGQHDPLLIPSLLRALDDETDIVVGSRFLAGSQKEYSVLRRWGILVFSLVTSVLGGSRIYDVTSGYRVYRWSALARLPPCNERHWAVEQTLTALRLGIRIKEVALPMPPRKDGDSQFRPYVAALYPIRVAAGVLRALRYAKARDGVVIRNE